MTSCNSKYFKVAYISTLCSQETLSMYETLRESELGIGTELCMV